jgi:hypothetical protein
MSIYIIFFSSQQKKKLLISNQCWQIIMYFPGSHQKEEKLKKSGKMKNSYENALK